LSFELENPEIAELVDQYKNGCIAYGDAKNHIVLELAKPFRNKLGLWDITEAQYVEFERKAKKLLLGKESPDVQYDS
jgi:hypothetical protein